jgi:hypothetical protein
MCILDSDLGVIFACIMETCNKTCNKAVQLARKPKMFSYPVGVGLLLPTPHAGYLIPTRLPEVAPTRVPCTLFSPLECTSTDYFFEK